MAIVKDQNYSFTLPTMSDGDTYKDCNFTQAAKHTILTTAENVKFVRCNLRNCDIPASSDVKDCLHFHLDIVDDTPTEQTPKDKAKDLLDKIKNIDGITQGDIRKAIKSKFTQAERNDFASAGNE
jgi:hypothetical protein